MNTENTQETDLKDNSSEEQVSHDEGITEVKEREVSVENTIDALLEQVVSERDTLRKENEKVQEQYQAALKSLERLILREGAVVSRDDKATEKTSAEKLETSADTYKPTVLEDIRGKLFMNK